MKYSNLFLFNAILIFAISFVSCSNDDDIPNDPAGAVILNMLNEDNGRTKLGYSDVYINAANNFYSSSYMFSGLGKKNGLGSISDIFLTTGTGTAAVVPGYAYQIFSSAAIKKFPSGKLALNIQSDYYNVFVDSQLKKDSEIIGAIVKFVTVDVPDNGLPTYGTNIGTLVFRDDNKHEIELVLPTSEFEYETTFWERPDEFEHKKDGNKLVVRLLSFSGTSNDRGFYIRIKDSYTYVHVIFAAY